MGVQYSLVRGNTSGIDEQELIDGQILFDKQKKLIALDAIVDGALTRIVMREETFNGTTAQWSALSDAQKEVFKYVNITDDYELHSGVFVGATSSSDGQVGLVTRPMAGDQNKYLRGDSSWGSPITYSSVEPSGAKEGDIWIV